MSLGVLPHVAFIGRAGSGKSTCAELLVKHFGYERLSFAAPLKVACGTTTDRGLLQAVGHGARLLHEDFWVNLLVSDLYSREVSPLTRGDADRGLGHFVIDDCRYPNEVQRLSVEGFVIVRVLADRGERVVRLKANGKLQDEAQLEHVSETALDSYQANYTIPNVGTPDALLEDLTSILNREQR